MKFTAGIAALMMISLLFSFSAGVNASDPDYSATINFAAGATQNTSYDYLTIVPENSSNPASITVKAWKSNMTVYIDESNVQNVTLDAKKAMQEFGVTSSDVDTALQLAGKIRVVLAGNGTNTYVVKNLPPVASVKLDGAVPGNYTLSGGTLTLTTHMSTHTLEIAFEPLYAPVFSLFDALVGFLVIVFVIGMVARVVNTTFGKIKFGRR